MAGRPKTKARAAIKLLELADILAAQTFHAAPRRDEGDKKRPAKPSTSEQAWEKAIEMTMKASLALEELAQALAGKAGMDLPHSLSTPGATCAETMQRLTTLADKASLTPPTQAEVDAIHQRIERDQAEAQAMAAADAEYEDGDFDFEDDVLDDDFEDEDRADAPVLAPPA